MNCVYAISGTYGLLPRLLYYVTLVFAIFGRSREWLIIGALVSALTYAGTAAIHTFVLAGSRKEVFDLDIIGTWAILSTGALAYIAMMHWSSTLRQSRAKLVFIIWGVLIGLSLIVGRVELFDTGLSHPEPACYSKSGQLLVYPIELISRDFNCTYKCFSATKAMRQSTEVMAVPRQTLDNHYSRLSRVLVGPIQFAAYASISFDSREHTPSQFCTRLVIKYLNPNHHENIFRLIYDASSEHWFGGYFALFHFARRSPWTWRKAVIYFLTIPWFVIGLLIDILALPMLFINIVLNEITILVPKLPTNEANYAIGQWGPWVSSALVVVAAIINKYMDFRARMELEERSEKELSTKASSSKGYKHDILEEQTIGIVKPSLAHIETLQDMGQSGGYRNRYR